MQVQLAIGLTVEGEMLDFLKIMSLNHTFIPQGGCCQWQSQLIGLHAIGDLLIALADYSIPAFLIYLASGARESALSKGWLLLGAWFFCDGTTHLMELVNLGYPNYWGSGFVKALTAVISWWAVATFAPLIPRFLAVFSPQRTATENGAIPNFIPSIQTQKTADRIRENQLAIGQTSPAEISQKPIAEIGQRQQVEAKLPPTSKQLRATLLRWERAVKLNPIAGIGFWDKSGTITEANNTLLEMIGYTQSDLQAGKINWRSITPPEYAGLDDRARQEILNSGYFHPYKKEFIHSSGRRVPIAIGGAMFETPDSGVFFVQDLTELTNIETARREIEARLLTVQELSLDGFNVLRSIRDSSGAIGDFEWEYVNPAAAKIQHSSPSVLIGKRILQVLPGIKTSGLFDSYVQVVETGIPHDIEVYYNSEGIVGWFRNMTVKVGDGVAISFTDITARKQVETSLRNALEKLTSHFNNSPLAVIEWDENFCCSGWSPAAEKIFGWREAEVLGLHFSDWKFIYAGDADTVKSAIYSFKSGRGPCNILRNSNYHKNGSLVRCEWYNSAFYNESGQLVSLQSLVLDVTERFNFLEVLRQSEERFRIAAESASDLIYEWDINSDILLWFGRVDEHLKYERGAFPRTFTAWKSIVHPDDRDRIALAVGDYLRACKDSTAPFFEEYRVVTREGGCLYWIDRAKVVLDNRGNPCKWIGVISDITDRKLAESERNQAYVREQAARRQAEASEQLYRILAEAIPQIVWTALPDGSVDYYNARWFEYTGMTMEQTQGWGWQPVLHPDDFQNCLERWTSSVQTGGTYEVEYRFKRASDGSYRWHLGRALPVRDAEGKIIKWFGTCTDIDDRKREAQTAYFRAKALAVLSASLDGGEALQGLADLAVPALADWCCVHLIDPDGSIRLAAVAHCDPNQVALLWQIDRRSPIDPHARHGVAKVLRSGESKVYAEIPDSVLAAVIPDAELLDSLRAFGPLSAMCVPLIARSRTLGAISLLGAESGRRYGHADLALVEEWARDAAVAVDNARLYREAAEANRLKDEFLATLSHELRTPLNAISGWAQMLRQRKLSPEKTAVALETIERNARLQTQMVEDLLEVSRIVSGKICLKMLPVDLARTIEAALQTVRPDAETRHIELTTFYEAGVGPAIGDVTRLQQIVWNLVSNAVKFTQPGGRVVVRLSSNNTNPPRIYNPKSPYPYVEITVSDTGIGISKEFLPFVFDRFRQADSTATRNYGGLGLGLAIVRHLVELHGGTVWVESPGERQGATFGVRLPMKVS